MIGEVYDSLKHAGSFLPWNPAVGDNPGNTDIEQIKLACPDNYITILPLILYNYTQLIVIINTTNCIYKYKWNID
jgi:hypothetical protein